MSYSINGLKIDNFELQNFNQEIDKIKKIATVEGDKKVCELFNIFLIHYLNSKIHNNTSYIKDFFYVFTEQQDIINFKTSATNLYGGLKDFFKNHLFDEQVYFYFLLDKDYCLVSLKKENFVSALVENLENYKPYSLSTSSGYTSYTGNKELTEEQTYEMVENDWELFTKNSFYIYEHAFSQTIFSYLDSFTKNISNLIDKRTLKEALEAISDDLVYYHHKEFFIEQLQKDTTDSKTFLKKRREILNSENIKNIILNDFKNKVDELDSVTLTELFNLDFDFK